MEMKYFVLRGSTIRTAFGEQSGDPVHSDSSCFKLILNTLLDQINNSKIHEAVGEYQISL